MNSLYLCGGEIVGEGGNGCVVTTDDENYVEKIGTDHIIQDEYELSELLQYIDPKQQYMIYALRGSLVCNNKTYIKELFQMHPLKSNRGRCSAIKSNNTSDTEKLCTYKMPRFLCDLDSTSSALQQVSLLDYLKNTMNLWNGLALLHKNHIVHSDIKLPNIALGLDRTFKYFDWGLSGIIDEEEDAIHQFKTLKETEFRYMPTIFKKQGDKDYSMNGIWHPKIYDDAFFKSLLEKPKFIQVFLKYNDVYSLVLVTIRILKKCIREKKLAERNDREKESVTQALEYLTLVYEDKNPFALSPSKTFNKVMELLDSILRAVESSI
jgi:serine/threonine protein kinase